MILAAALIAPALAQPVAGAEKVGFADVFGWWLPGTEPRPAVIGLHGCNGLYVRGELNARERSMAELLRSRGFHVRDVRIPGARIALGAVPGVVRSRHSAKEKIVC